MSEKCIKCSKMIPDEQVSNGKQTPQGFVCANCSRKNKGGIIAGALIAVALLGSGGYWYYNSQQKTNTQEQPNISNDYVGAGEADDNIDAQTPKEPTFNWQTSLAISSPLTNVGGTIDNIDSFKRQMEENLKNAEANKSAQIAIPSIGMLFEKGSYVLKQETQDLLKEFAKTYLQTNKEAVLLVEGYTCDLGTDKLNDRLSERRAETIKNNLIAEGVPTDKVEIKWYGESQYNNSPYKTREVIRRVNVSFK